MFETFTDGLLLLLGMALGWALSRRGSATDAEVQASAGTAQARTASVATSEPGGTDEAVAALARAADAGPQAASLQLALGGLFRRRGETDRAIRVHEGLLSRSDLPPAERRSAQLELAQDYLKAGLLDRAEALLQPLSVADDSAAALELLLELEEQSQGWRAAIETAQRWQAVSGRSAGARIAQYRCQLADLARESGDAESAERLARQALAEDSACVRASLLLAQLAQARGEWPIVIDSSLRAIEQDPRFISEVIAALREAYGASGDTRGYAAFLDDAGRTLPGSATVALARAERSRESGHDPRSDLAQQLGVRPTRQSLLAWLAAQPELKDESAGLRGALERSIKSRPGYACLGCGLQPSLLFWQCPGCKRWGTVGPVEEAL